MKFGLCGRGGGLEADGSTSMFELARLAEDLGFDCRWLNEEHFLQAPGDRSQARLNVHGSPIVMAAAPGDGDYSHPSGLLGSLAALTPPTAVGGRDRNARRDLEWSRQLRRVTPLPQQRTTVALFAADVMPRLAT